MIFNSFLPDDFSHIFDTIKALAPHMEEFLLTTKSSLNHKPAPLNQKLCEDFNTRISKIEDEINKIPKNYARI